MSNNIIVINPTELRTNIKKFLNRAERDRVVIKSGKKYYELTVSEVIYANPNPSPSGDEWFEDPENVKIVKEGIASYKAGKVKKFDDTKLKNALK